MDPISQWVGNVGFPIAAYLLMYRLVTTTLDKNTQAIHTVSVAMRRDSPFRWSWWTAG